MHRTSWQQQPQADNAAARTAAPTAGGNGAPVLLGIKGEVEDAAK